MLKLLQESESVTSYSIYLFCHTFAPHSVKVHLICFGEKEMFFVLFQAS